MRYKGEQAIGLIETIGMVPALLAADAMYPPLCRSPLLRHAHALWTSPFVRNRYVHEPQSAEWSTVGQEDCYVREFSTGDCSVIGQRASSQLGFCRTACPKTLRSWIMGWRVEHLRTRLDALAHACSCRPCLLVLPMLYRAAHACAVCPCLLVPPACWLSRSPNRLVTPPAEPVTTLTCKFARILSPWRRFANCATHAMKRELHVRQRHQRPRGRRRRILTRPVHGKPGRHARRAVLDHLPQGPRDPPRRHDPQGDHHRAPALARVHH